MFPALLLSPASTTIQFPILHTKLYGQANPVVGETCLIPHTLHLVPSKINAKCGSEKQ